VIVTIGVIIGLVLGLTGAGGSVFAVPLLVLGLDMSIQEAAGLSLGAVCFSALLGVLIRLKSRDIQWLPALVFASVGAVAAPFGTQIASRVDEYWVMVSFTVLVGLIARRMWVQARVRPLLTTNVRASVNGNSSQLSAVCGTETLSLTHFRFACFARIAGAAWLTGVLSGFYGVGGGFLIVPVLMGLLRLHIQQAVGTSLFVITIISGAGFWAYTAQASIDVSVFQSVAAGGLVGMLVGIALSRRLAGPSLQRFFAIMMVAIAIVMLLKRVLLT